MINVRIVIVTAVYYPEPVVSARMGRDLATYFAKQGSSVTVICPQPSRPSNADYSRYKKYGSSINTQEDGFEVVRLPSFAATSSRLITRFYESWSFGKHVCSYLATNMRYQPDVLYINAWPLLAQAQIVHYASRKRIPVVLQIMDIYPESLLNRLPAVLRGMISMPLTLLDAWIARKVRSLVVISENMRRTYTEIRRIPPERVVTIPTWQNESIFDKAIERKEACQRYDIPDNLFTFLYLGNIGPVAGVDFLIQAFFEASIKSAQLLIVGDGSSKTVCVKLAAKLNASNVHFISDPNANNVPILQSMAHVCMLPLKSVAGKSSIPSKLPAYMFSAKPVIATVDKDSDTAYFIKQAECGWVGEPEDLRWLANKMREVARLSTDELALRGQHGQQFALCHFSKYQSVQRLAEVIMLAKSKPLV